MNRKMTDKEKIGYIGEKTAVKILEARGFSNIRWLHSVSLSEGGPFDIIAEKGDKRYYIDVKSSTSNKRRLPVHDHSLIDLVNAAKKDHAIPLFIIIKPSGHHFVDPYKLLSGQRVEGAYVYYCYLKNRSNRDLKKLLCLRKRRCLA